MYTYHIYVPACLLLTLLAKLSIYFSKNFGKRISICSIEFVLYIFSELHEVFRVWTIFQEGLNIKIRTNDGVLYLCVYSIYTINRIENSKCLYCYTHALTCVRTTTHIHFFFPVKHIYTSLTKETKEKTHNIYRWSYLIIVSCHVRKIIAHR